MLDFFNYLQRLQNGETPGQIGQAPPAPLSGFGYGPSTGADGATSPASWMPPAGALGAMPGMAGLAGMPGGIPGMGGSNTQGTFGQFNGAQGGYGPSMAQAQMPGAGGAARVGAAPPPAAPQAPPTAPNGSAAVLGGGTPGVHAVADPRQAVYNALQQSGVANPLAPTPWLREIMKRADDIVAGVLNRSVMNDPGALNDTASFQNAVNAQVKNALGGGGTGIGVGNNDVQGLLGKIKTIWDDIQNGGAASPGMQVVGDLFSDTTRMGNLLNSILYGGESDTVARSLGAPLTALGWLQQQQFQKGTGVSALDLLLNGQVPGMTARR